MSGWLRTAALAGVLGLGLTQGWAQSGRIYSCVDAAGRRLTSDRLIPECNDREQQLMNHTGGVRAVLPPPPTAREREVKAEQERKLEAEKQRQAEEKRAERALLYRYPNQAVHNGERVKAVRAVEDVAATVHHQIEELNQQKKKLKEETEFFKDPSQYPARLKRQMEENDQQLAAQRRLLAIQDEEKKRINARFDEELGRLKLLWGAMPPAAAPAAGIAAGPAKLR